MNPQTNNFPIAPNFNLREFQMPETGEVLLNLDLLVQLQALRDLVAQPFTITSGYRTVEHNAAVGGVENSQHLVGEAVDVTVRRESWAQLVQLAADNPALNVFDETDHIHIALIKTRPPEQANCSECGKPL